MILSKANLQAIQIVKKDRGTPALYVLYIDEDGTTTCVSQQAVMCVSPVESSIKKNLSHLKESKISAGVKIIVGETIEDAIKNIPRDTLFKGLLEHCDLDNDCKISLHDGKRGKSIKGSLQKMKPMPYVDVIKRSLNNKQQTRSVVNLVRLRALLEAIEKACGDQSGELPIYIEFSDKNDIIIRAEHPKFGQRILAIMTTYKGISGKWMDENEWEYHLKQDKPKLKRKLKLKLR